MIGPQLYPMPITFTHRCHRISLNPSPSQTVRSVLDEAVRKLKLSGYFQLQYNGTTPDLSLPFRLAGIPNMAKVDLVQIEERGEIISLGIQTTTGRTVLKIPDDRTFREILQDLGIDPLGLHMSILGNEIKDLDCSLRKLGVKSTSLITMIRPDGEDVVIKQSIQEEMAPQHIVSPHLSDIHSETDDLHLIRQVSRDPSRPSSSQPPTTMPDDIKVLLPIPVPDKSTDSDYEMTPAQFQTYHSILAERYEGSRLLTQKQRELGSKPELSYIKIKVRFPDGVSVVATFGKESLVKYVYTWLRGIIKIDCAFTIYLTSPYTEIQESELPLVDVVPRGSVMFHFRPLAPFEGSNGFLNDEYMSLARDASHIPAATGDDDKTVLTRHKDDKKDDKLKGLPKWLKFGKTK
ncbi:Plant UBX domain-containing protein 1 [Neolecta irregularis DAH-3]|uniref:Plant UBX domain-containing protein 1 n=1 Tax=Neolecta irregularis (strain DAH-3) TaxID=1198029 RepID=A0A1U7LU44_NEOID|nr:Plant UBX domain-containing protein 1 [Neolecta irregularis DAH-3]|eukprot:OLL26138.1 Plant UBX domain-containing protein 1 [Neolecta irregularis DAH-3]